VSDILFFGAWGRPGHYYWLPGRRWAETDRSPPASLQGGKIDGRLAPQKRAPRYPNALLEVEGEAAVHHIDGWTVVAWWDRSVDRRGGSNSAFLMRGTHTMSVVFLEAADKFPELLPRFATLVEVKP
jgi:hypothetical protein